VQTAIVALAVVAALTGGVSAQKAVADQKAALLTFAKSTQSNFWKWATTNKWVDTTDPCGDAAATPAVPAWDFVTCSATGDITYVPACRLPVSTEDGGGKLETKGKGGGRV
jgi:hypothetical protein